MQKSRNTAGKRLATQVLVSNGYRFLIHDNYLMFYYYVKEENTVYVNAVFNAKQDYTRVMKKFI